MSSKASKIQELKQALKEAQIENARLRTIRESKSISGPHGEISPQKSEALNNIPLRGKTFFMEEFGPRKDLLRVDLFAQNSDGPEHLVSLSLGKKLRLSKFIENRLELVEVHEHDYGVEHRVWKLTKRDLRALKELITEIVNPVFKREGWDGVKKIIEKYRNLSENPLTSDWRGLRGIIDELPSRLSTLRYKLLEYANEHDLKIGEAVTALTLEDDKFAEEYNSLKNELKEQFKEWKGIFSPYFSSDKKQIPENGGE